MLENEGEFNFFVQVEFNEGSILSTGTAGAEQVKACGSAVEIAQGLFKGNKFHRTKDGAIKEGYIGDMLKFKPLSYRVETWGVSIGFMEALRCAYLKNGQEPLTREQEGQLGSLPSKRVPIYNHDAGYDTGQACWQLRFDPEAPGLQLFLEPLS